MTKRALLTRTAAGLVLTGIITVMYLPFSEASAYGSFKASLKNSMGSNSFTYNITAEINDSGTKKVSYSSKSKINKSGKKVDQSSFLKTSERTQQLKLLMDGANLIVERPEGAKAINLSASPDLRKKFGSTSSCLPEPAKDVERLIDALVINLHSNLVQVRYPDGSKEIQLALTRKDIPVVVNTAASLVISGVSQSSDSEDSSYDFNIRKAFPKLTHQIKVHSIKMNTKINSRNLAESQYLFISLTGKDDSKKIHNLELIINIAFNDFA